MKNWKANPEQRQEPTGKARECMNGLRETGHRLLTDAEQRRAAPAAGGMQTTAKGKARGRLSGRLSTTGIAWKPKIWFQTKGNVWSS